MDNEIVQKFNSYSLYDVYIKINDEIKYLKSKTLVIILVSAIFGSIGLTFSYIIKPKYIAILTFSLEDEKNAVSGLGGAIGLASSLGLDIGGGSNSLFNGSSIIELMKSRKITELTLLCPIDKQNANSTLAQMYLKMKGWDKIQQTSSSGKYISFPTNIDRQSFTIQQDSILGILCEDISKNNLKVYQKDKKVSIINIEFKSTSEIFSKLYIENLVKEVSTFYVDIRSAKSKSNVAILQKQADSIRSELNFALAGAAIESDRTYNLNPAFNIKRVPTSKRQVDVQANSAILTQLVTNLELAKIALRKETPLIQIIDKPILPLKKEKLGKLKGIIIGGIAGCVIICIVLLYKRHKQNNK